MINFLLIFHCSNIFDVISYFTVLTVHVLKVYCGSKGYWLLNLLKLDL